MASLYPVTIFRARYGGVYEGGEWVAFNLDPENVPDAATADDVSCHAFFVHYEGSYGHGKTPDEALTMLAGIEHPLRMEYDKGWKLVAEGIEEEGWS